MKSPLIMLREVSPTANNVEKEIIKYILAHPEEVTKLSIQKLAANSYSSPSSVLRLCKLIGYDGYKEFKHALLTELVTIGQEDKHSEENVTALDSTALIIEKTTNNNIQSLIDTRHLIDDKVLDEVVEKIHDANTINLFGLGASLEACNDFFLKMLRLGKHANFTSEYHTQIINALNVKKGDICIFISYSGETEEILEINQIAKEKEGICVAITRYGETSLSKNCDYVLNSSSNESMFSCGTMSSRISQLNLLDILFNLYCSKYYEEATMNLTKTHMKKNASEIF
ncbi:MAG: MurR/RpiR family transcriptional regulator [Erysipelotrichaceae bacterium]|nr:MurR/RpiR family transcriptional regulator [Erysipelotrichaceae bacterium]